MQTVESTPQAAAPPPDVAAVLPEPTTTPVWQYLLATAGPFVEEARPVKRSLDRTAYLSTLVYENKHRIWYSKKADWYFEVPGQNHYTTLYHPENYYRFLIKSNAKEYAKSQPSIRARAPRAERERGVAAARVADAVKGDFSRRHRHEAVRQVEHRRVQLGGNTIVFVDWDPTAGDELEFPIYETRQVKPVPDAYRCYSCKTEDELPAPAEGTEQVGPDRCPKCQSYGVDVVRVPTITRHVEVDRLRVPTGDWIVRSIPVFEINVNAGARDHHELTDVIWLRWQYIQHRKQANARWRGKRLGSGITDTDEERGARYQRELQGAIGGDEVDDRTSTGIYRDAVIITEDWYQPVAYADYRAAIDHEIIPGSGIWIRAGQMLTELFPKGLRFLHAGREPLEIRAQAIRRHFQFYGFDPNPESFWYSGTEDGVSLQLDLNEVNALIKTNAMSASMPTTIVRGQFVKNFGLSNHPSKYVEIGAAFPLEHSLDNLIHTVTPANLANGVYELRDKIKEGMQYATAALNNFNGADAARDRTATQTSILEAAALAHAEQVISGLAASEARLCRLATALWREHAELPRAFELAGEAGGTDIAEFSKADLVVDVEFVVEQGTVLPRRPYQEKADFESWVKQNVEYTGASGGQPMPSKLRRYAANLYGLSSLLVDERSAENVARRHLEALRELARSPQQALAEIVSKKATEAIRAPGLVPVEAAAEAALVRASALAELTAKTQSAEGRAELLLEWIRVTPGAPAKVIIPAHKHLEMRDWYEEYLNDERSAEDSEQLVALVAARMREHVLASGEKQADFTRAKLAADGPAMEAEAAARQAAAQQQFMQKAALDQARHEKSETPEAPADQRRARSAAEGSSQAARPAA